MTQTTPSHRVAAEVRALMGRHKTSQQELADSIGIAQTSVSRRLRGDHPFTTDELYAIAALFNVPVASLMPEIAIPA